MTKGEKALQAIFNAGIKIDFARRAFIITTV